MPEKSHKKSATENGGDHPDNQADHKKLVEHCLLHGKRVARVQEALEYALGKFAHGFRAIGITETTKQAELIILILQEGGITVKREDVERALIANGIRLTNAVNRHRDVLRTDISGAMFWGDEYDD